MRRRRLLAVAAAGLCAAVARAQGDPVEAPVALFQKACVDPGLTIAAQEAAIAADAGWAAADAGKINVPGFAIVPTRDPNFDFAKPVTVRHWTREQDGATVHVVLATFPAGRRYPDLCAVIVPFVRGALPYFDDFKVVARSIGLSAKLTDLPHYYEFSGKPQPDHPVRADMFSRTRAVADKNSMHLYVAF